jgi:hypothetical protein
MQDHVANKYAYLQSIFRGFAILPLAHRRTFIAYESLMKGKYACGKFGWFLGKKINGGFLVA